VNFLCRWFWFFIFDFGDWKCSCCCRFVCLFRETAFKFSIAISHWPPSSSHEPTVFHQSNKVGDFHLHTCLGSSFLEFFVAGFPFVFLANANIGLTNRCWRKTRFQLFVPPSKLMTKYYFTLISFGLKVNWFLPFLTNWVGFSVSVGWEWRGSYWEEKEKLGQKTRIKCLQRESKLLSEVVKWNGDPQRL